MTKEQKQLEVTVDALKQLLHKDPALVTAAFIVLQKIEDQYSKVKMIRPMTRYEGTFYMVNVMWLSFAAGWLACKIFLHTP